MVRFIGLCSLALALILLAGWSLNFFEPARRDIQAIADAQMRTTLLALEQASLAAAPSNVPAARSSNGLLTDVYQQILVATPSAPEIRFELTTSGVVRHLLGRSSDPFLIGEYVNRGDKPLYTAHLQLRFLDAQGREVAVRIGETALDVLRPGEMTIWWASVPRKLTSSSLLIDPQARVFETWNDPKRIARLEDRLVAQRLRLIEPSQEWEYLEAEATLSNAGTTRPSYVAAAVGLYRNQQLVGFCQLYSQELSRTGLAPGASGTVRGFCHSPTKQASAYTTRVFIERSYY